MLSQCFLKLNFTMLMNIFMYIFITIADIRRPTFLKIVHISVLQDFTPLTFTP